MKIEVNNLSKFFNDELIFKDINFQFQSGEKYAILGNNGSGKTTLLKILIGAIMPTAGFIQYNKDAIIKDNLYKHIAYVSPDFHVIEQLNLEDFFSFYTKFRKFWNNINLKSLLSLANLENTKKKPISSFSSGMKQRLILLIAFLSESDILFLDEPCSNLDQEGIQLYNILLNDFLFNRTLIVCSNNRKEEIKICSEYINLSNYK